MWLVQFYSWGTWGLEWLRKHSLKVGSWDSNSSWVWSQNQYPSAHPFIHTWPSQVALVVKNPPANAGDIERWVWSLGWEDPLEKEMATHSSILARRIPWTEEPEGLQSIELQIHPSVIHPFTHLLIHHSSFIHSSVNHSSIHPLIHLFIISKYLFALIFLVLYWILKI